MNPHYENPSLSCVVKTDFYNPPYGRGFQAVTVTSREHEGQATTTAFAPPGIRIVNTVEHP